MDSIQYGSVLFMVGLPAEVLDDHGVSPLIAETGSSLHKIEIAVVLVVSEEVVLHLQVHLFQFDVNVLYLFKQGLVFKQFHLLHAQLVLLHLGQVQALYPFSDLTIDLLI